MKPILYWKVGRKLFTDYEEARKFEHRLVARANDTDGTRQISNTESSGQGIGR